MSGRDTDQSCPVQSIPMQPWAALSARRARRGPEPLVTYVDARIGHSGERTELSATTVENSVAKIANALRDEFDIEPGAAVGLHLPWHWQRSLWWGGCAAVGAQVVPYGDPGTVDLVACTIADIDHLASAGTSTDILVISLHPLGLPIAEPLPEGFIDATGIVRAQPDAFVPDAVSSAIETTVNAPADALPSQRTLVACQVPGHAGSRPESWAWPLAIPLATDGSVVMVATWDEPGRNPVDLTHLAAQERAERIVRL